MKLTKGDAVSGPTSSAGLVRYFDVAGNGIQVTPEVIVGLAVFFIAAEVVIKFFV